MVNFGKYIESCRVEKYGDKYVDYENLKQLLDELKGNKIRSSENFYKALDENWVKTKGFAENWLMELEQNPKLASKDVSNILELNQFVFVNQEALRKIIKKHDKNVPFNKLYTIWRWKIDFSFTLRIIDTLLSVISPGAESTNYRSCFDGLLDSRPEDEEDELSILIEGNNHNGTDAKLQKQTDSFVRQSTKYWVKPCDLAAVCTALVENIGVHSFEGRSPWTYVSSIYLDNKERRCYTERQKKDTGARVVRLRTYDRNNSKVYVERKVHYEKWTGEISSKDRFVIGEEQVMPLLRGQTISVGKKHENLAKEVQKMVNDYQMYPTLRVDYQRLAFQARDHDHVRVSIDLNLSFVNEKTSHMEWRTSDESLSARDEVLFPYIIVEIKLREPFISKPPQWLSDLESSSLLHKENLFSKYIHGTYEFYLSRIETGEVSRKNVLAKPFWFDALSFTSPQMPVVSFEDIKKTKKYLQKKKSYANAHWCVRLFGLQPDVDQSGKPVRVEPKTFFANERTFLTWFNCAIFVSSIGIAVASQGAGNGRIEGGLLILIGFLITIYASFTYAQRTFSLLNKKAAGYADRYGPLVLAAVTMGIFIGAFIVRSFSTPYT